LPSAGRLDRPLLVAAVLGTLHGLVSIYWGLGGRWLLETLGEAIVTRFADVVLVLVPIGLVKIGFAWLPLVLSVRRWPARRLWRPVCWLGVAVLVLWGGLNTLVGNLVLAGVIRPGDGFDRAAMVGHAWLWDPLFLLWGATLAVGLWRSRSAGVAQPVRGIANGPR